MELRGKQGRVLKIVFVINLIMFFVEFSFGIWAKSTALMGDSLDMLGDALVYGFSLYVIYKSIEMRATAAKLKGFIMLLFGLSVLVEASYKILTNVVPVYETMTVIGISALIANLICLYLLYKHRADDINMKSTWICSRNDIFANSGTILAALLVGKFQTIWPDVIVGLLISILFLSSAFHVLKEAFLTESTSQDLK